MEEYGERLILDNFKVISVCLGLLFCLRDNVGSCRTILIHKFSLLG